MDPVEFSSLNELLDRIAALGIATDYDRIGPKTDQGETETPPVTHQIAVVVEQDGESSSISKTDYVRRAGRIFSLVGIRLFLIGDPNMVHL